MDRVVNYFALLIIFVFDPLAVTLVVAYNRLQMDDGDDDDGDDPDGNVVNVPTVFGPTDGGEITFTPGTQEITVSGTNWGTGSGNVTWHNLNDGQWSYTNLEPDVKEVLYENLWDLYDTGSSEEEPVTEHSVWNMPEVEDLSHTIDFDDGMDDEPLDKEEQHVLDLKKKKSDTSKGLVRNKRL